MLWNRPKNCGYSLKYENLLYNVVYGIRIVRTKPRGPDKIHDQITLDSGFVMCYTDNNPKRSYLHATHEAKTPERLLRGFLLISDAKNHSFHFNRRPGTPLPSRRKCCKLKQVKHWRIPIYGSGTFEKDETNRISVAGAYDGMQHGCLLGRRSGGRTADRCFR